MRTSVKPRADSAFDVSADAAALDSAGAVFVTAAPYVTIGLAAAITGLSPKAIEKKIEEGVWLENQEWRRGPDGRRYVSVRGFQAWVECRRG